MMPRDELMIAIRPARFTPFRTDASRSAALGAYAGNQERHIGADAPDIGQLLRRRCADHQAQVAVGVPLAGFQGQAPVQSADRLASRLRPVSSIVRSCRSAGAGV